MALACPSNLTSLGTVPLLLVFHGMGASGEMAVEDYSLAELANRESIIIAAPNGLPVWPERPVSFRRNPRIWRTRPLAHGAPVDEVKFTRACIDALDERFSARIDRSRVYVCGFSNGGQLVWKLVVEAPEVIAAAGIVCSTHSPQPRSGQRPVPVMWVLGSRDPFCPLEGGTIEPPWGGRHVAAPVARVRDAWLDAQDISRQPCTVENDEALERREFRGLDANRRFVQLIVHNMGHHWPGSPSRLGERTAGPISDPFSASHEILRFCKGYTRDVSMNA